MHTKEGVQVDYVVTGDSLQSQHPMTKHFGLGALAQVDAVVVVWPNGKRTEVTQPAVDQYHRLQAPWDMLVVAGLPYSAPSHVFTPALFL